MLRALRAALAATSALVLLATAPHGATAQGTRFLRQPSVGPGAIAFVHANDIWVVARDGGQARRLTSDAGAETEPAFSPDGKWIAFTGEYGGNQDVYVVAAAGGQPQRLTWHPGADVVQGWTPDGKVLFQSGRQGVPTRLTQFFTVPVSGGLPRVLPVHQAYQGEMSDDGRMVAYQEIGYWDPEWRNYRGGQAQPVRVVTLASLGLETPPWEGERQMDPTWMDGVVYYMSERDWAVNVWSYDPRTKQEKQLTRHADFDVKSLDAGHGVVVYEQAGYLHEMNPATGAGRRLVVQAQGDQNWARARWEDVPANQLTNPRLSPTGKRALFEHRGDVFTVPADAGSWRNLTESSGVADRYPVWSPDGNQIAWFNDQGGEYGLVIADQEGNSPRRIAIPGNTFYFTPAWSPDGARIAFTDTDFRVRVVELASGKVTDVDGEEYADPRRSIDPVWSPDSRYIAYTKRMGNLLRAVMVHDVRSGETRQLTDGMADVIAPVWDASGKYLYFLGSTDYALNTAWLDMTAYDRPVTRALYAAILRAGEPSPFLPKSDEEGGAPTEEKKPAAGAATAAAPAAPPAVTIDFDGIASRIVAAPGLPVRNYTGLEPAPEGMVFVAEAIPNEQGATLHRYSLKDRKATEWVKGVNDATVSHDRKKILWRSGSNWTVSDAGGAPPKPGDGRLALALRVRIEPKEEWAQMLRDGWRFMRDFLYVDNTHGAPWNDVWSWYSAWLPDVEHRADFNLLLDMVSGEIAVGHSYVRGGDYPELDNPRTGLLGVDLEEADGGYRITRIYTGESWNPGLVGPLGQPGMDVKEGDFLVAIDGTPLAPPANPYRLLEGAAGRTIKVRVNGRPGLEGSRELTVEPVANEGQLRSWAWVEGNRRKVDELSGGKLAYVYLPNTGQGGYTYFNRMYFAQQDRKGAVIDERNNGGGSAADYIIEVLDRELMGYFNSRTPSHRVFTQPMSALWGPKTMIINERSGSGGDLMPFLFRSKKIGPLVGTRTWGGLVHTADTPPLIDGGRFVAPRGGFFNVDGEWDVEAVGVAPDIEVKNDPKDVAAGRDPQLEAAVAETLKRLATEGIQLKAEPAPPVRYRRPVRSGGS
ncbi:MAG TPA: PDZ domain-containing protein [Longimicrobiales bacterium]|nr:PDZ domain-containing protein [Longimicrobiales bacterium]